MKRRERQVRREILIWPNASVIMAGVWLTLLVIPILGIANEDISFTLKFLAWTIIGAFAATYLSGLRRLGVFLPKAQRRKQLARLGVLALLATALIPIIGGWALSLTPFLVAFAAWGLWRPLAFTFASTILVITAAATAATGWQDNFQFVITDALVMIIGLVMTNAIERQDAAEELARSKLVAAERERMARDVHDLLGHSLTVVSLKAQLAERLIDTDPAQARDEVAQIREIAADALAGVRQTVTGSRVSSIAEELASAQQALAAAGLTSTVYGSPEDPRGPAALVAGWVLREATTNVLRHAQASRCDFRFGESEMVIEDDGIGMNRSEGNGVRGMRERIAAAGGQVNLTKSHLGGTAVEVTW